MTMKHNRSALVNESHQWRDFPEGGGCCCSFCATNLFLCGHEWVKRLSGETPQAFICTQKHQRAAHSSPPLHVPYSLQHSLYSYSTRRRKSLVGSSDACKRRHTEQPPTSCSIRLHTGAATQQHGKKTRPNTCVLYVTVQSQERKLSLTVVRRLLSEKFGLFLL